MNSGGDFVIQHNFTTRTTASVTRIARKERVVAGSVADIGAFEAGLSETTHTTGENWSHITQQYR